MVDSRNHLALSRFRSHCSGENEPHHASGATPPTLVAYDQDLLAERAQYNSQDELLALSLFKALRKYQTAILKSLPNEMFEKFGMHEERGKLTLADMVSYYADHAETHLKHIERIKEELAHMER